MGSLTLLGWKNEVGRAGAAGFGPELTPQDVSCTLKVSRERNPARKEISRMEKIHRILLTAVLVTGIVLPVQSVASQQAQPAGNQAAGTQPAEKQQPPLTLKEVIHLVKKNKKHLEKISPEIVSRGVDFDLTAEISQQLTKAGATPDFIANIQNLGPTARAQMASHGAVPPEQGQAFRAIENELDPDRKIQLVDDFASKYPDSALLTYAYFLAQGAALQKGDIKSVINYGEKSLALKADNFSTLIMMTKILPLPQSIENDPNPDTKLDEAEKDGHKALELMDTIKKGPNETDEDFQARKNIYLENIHSGLAMVHLQRAMEGLAGIDQEELGKAESEYRQAISASASPNAEDYFRLGEVCGFENKVDDAIQAYTKASQLSTDNPALKNLADQRVSDLKRKKK
jgi:tetratricopeptide (TPR) repeat protein